jgi:hypothetical protein
MRLTSRHQFIEIVQHQYFGSMARAQPGQILPLLADAAVLTGFFGSDAPRLVRQCPGLGEESFERFLGALHAEFALSYTDFEHFIDVDEQRSACTFLLEVTPRNATSTLPTRKLRNCNFFQFEQGLITAVTAYFASPPVDIDPWRR